MCQANLTLAGLAFRVVDHLLVGADQHLYTTVLGTPLDGVIARHGLMDTLALIDHASTAYALVQQIVVNTPGTTFGETLVVVHSARIVRMTDYAEVGIWVFL